MNTEYNSLSVSRANTQMKVSIHTAGYMHTAGIRVRARVRVSSGELHVFLISHHPAMSTGHAMISNYMHFNYTHGFPCVQHRCTQIQAYSNKHIHTPTDRQTHRDIQRHRRTDTQTDRQRQRDRETDRHTDSQPASQPDRQTERQRDRHTDRQPASQPASQPDRPEVD